WPVEKIAHWRDQGGQAYADVDRLRELAGGIGFQPVPALFDMEASGLPTTLEDTYQVLLGYESSPFKLAGAADGVPEGVVVRSPDRGRIAKLRREDYERTLRRREKKK